LEKKKIFKGGEDKTYKGALLQLETKILGYKKECGKNKREKGNLGEERGSNNSKEGQKKIMAKNIEKKRGPPEVPTNTVEDVDRDQRKKSQKRARGFHKRKNVEEEKQKMSVQMQNTPQHGGANEANQKKKAAKGERAANPPHTPRTKSNHRSVEIYDRRKRGLQKERRVHSRSQR